MSLTDLLDRPPTRGAAQTYLHMLLPQLADQMPIIDDIEDERIHYGQAARIISAIIHTDVQYGDVQKAFDACEQLYKLNNGYCMTELLGEDPSAENRAHWIDIYEQQLIEAIRDMTGLIPEQVAA